MKTEHAITLQQVEIPKQISEVMPAHWACWNSKMCMYRKNLWGLPSWILMPCTWYKITIV